MTEDIDFSKYEALATDGPIEENVENPVEETMDPDVESKTEVKEEPTTPVENNTDSIGKSWTNKIPVLGQIKWAGDVAAQGTADFIADAAGMAGEQFNVPWLKKYDDWWDTHNPKSKDPFHTLVRDVSAVVVPSLVANRVLIGGLASATKARHINGATRTLWSILAQAGIDTSVAGITSQSYEQDNAAGALNKLFGWNIPWGTDDSMGQEERRHLHMYEAGAMSVGVDLTGALLSFGKKLRFVNQDLKATQLLEKDARNLRAALGTSESVDDVTKAVDGRKGTRETLQQDEAMKRLSTKLDDEYDPFINQPARPEQRAVAPDDFNPNALKGKADEYLIQNNKGSIDGIPNSVVSGRVMDSIAETTDITDRAFELGKFFDDDLSANADLVLKGNEIPAAELNKAVDNVVGNLFDPEVSFDQFQRIIKEGQISVMQGRKVLSERNWIIASEAWTKAHRELFDPNNMRASAMMAQQAGHSIATTARSLNLLDGIATSSRQWEIMSKKMKFLVGEVQANKDIIKRGVELREVIKTGKFERVAEWLNLQADSFDSGLRASKAKAYQVIDEIERIAKEYPHYMRPLAEAYDATNGDINTLHKLHQWTEANIGLLKKGIYDRHPEMPSMFIRGLQSIRYNNILNGLAPLNALAGNSIIATVKPISVLTGALATQDVATFKRALYTYGGFIENFKRGFKMLGSDWRLANSNPEIAVKRGRRDFKSIDLERIQVMDTQAMAWEAEGQTGKVAMYNAAKMLSHWSNWNINRFGINGLYAIDGFFKSLMASGSARAKAYDALFEATNGAFHKSQFQDLQRHLYDQAFDANGLLKDKGADFAHKELALNLDYNYVEKFEHFLNHVPAAKALFMFPRTGVNGLELTWSFNPVSNLGPAITRARRTLAATTPGEIAEVLAEHGLDNTPEAFKTLQAEYIGRQLMGGAVVFGAGMWALEGNLTGHGPQDPAERQRMIRMGWQPLSLKNPITGKWLSYRGAEPFESILSLVGDMHYYSDRVDQSIAEDWLGKVLAGITMNTTNQTFTAGLEPLVSLFSGDEAAWNRFVAQIVDTAVIPGRGVRSILNNIISPQLRDVKNDFQHYLMNYNKFMFPPQPTLPNMVDVYTGRPIKFHEKLTAAANAFSPTFKQNGGMEPWRQWLLSTGWDGLSKPMTDKITGGNLEPHARQWMNNWIGQHGGLKGQIIKLMNERPDKWEKDLQAYKKGLGITGTQEDTPIKKTLLHSRISDIHYAAFQHAYIAYEIYLNETGQTHKEERSLRDQIKNNLAQGKTDKAFELRDQLLQYKK